MRTPIRIPICGNSMMGIPLYGNSLLEIPRGVSTRNCPLEFPKGISHVGIPRGTPIVHCSRPGLVLQNLLPCFQSLYKHSPLPLLHNLSTLCAHGSPIRLVAGQWREVKNDDRRCARMQNNVAPLNSIYVLQNRARNLF